MNAYERIRYEGRTAILRDPVESEFLGETVLSGIEVNRHGDEVKPVGADERRRIIAVSLITSRTLLSWDKHYAVLRPARAGDDTA